MKNKLVLLAVFLAAAKPVHAGFSFGLGKAVAKRGGNLIDQVAGPPLPACGAGPYFSVSPIAPADFTSITPLGNLNPSGHTFPTDHTYVQLANSSRQYALFMPGDARITSVGVSEYLSGATRSADYTVNFSPCSSLTAYYGHVSVLSQDLLNKIGGFSNCQVYTTGGITVRRCDKKVRIDVKGGTQIGTTSTLDFGAYDTRRPLPFANPSRHPLPTLYAVCPGNYFTGDLQALFNSRYGGSSGARTVEPLCGSVNQDATGTAQGDWYPAGIPNLQLEDSGLALVHDNVEPSTGAFSVGNAVPNVTVGVYKFMPAHSGQVNREFSEVTADGNVYCYDSFFFLPGSFSGSLLIQLVNASTLNIQKQSATSCGAGPWTMSAPTSFSR